ncbi:MAG: hypothetical protein LAO78_04315 [Acidobacteriia bacterium]|nr:hypothetical protein [Terriglobia bacterium]
MKHFILTAMCCLLLAGGACFAQTAQPSLADLAARGRHSTRKASKIITNDDIATATPHTGNEQAAAKVAPAAGFSAATSSPGKSAEKTESAKNNSSTSKDSPAVAALKKQLDSYKEQQDGWKHSVKKYEDLLATETSDFRRQMYQDALEGDKHNVALFQEKIDQTQADLAKAQKEASSGHGGSN